MLFRAVGLLAWEFMQGLGIVWLGGSGLWAWGFRASYKLGAVGFVESGFQGGMAIGNVQRGIGH